MTTGLRCNCPPTAATTYQTRCGTSLSQAARTQSAAWVARRRTTGASSTRCWIIRTGAPWRDLPPDYGDWKITHRRYSRWRDEGVWERLLEALIDEPDFEWLMIDASYVKVHAHGTGAVGGSEAVGRTKGG